MQTIFLFFFFEVNLAKTIPQVIRANPSQWSIGNDVFISWNASELASEKMYIDVLGLTVSNFLLLCYLCAYIGDCC